MTTADSEVDIALAGQTLNLNRTVRHLLDEGGHFVFLDAQFTHHGPANLDLDDLERIELRGQTVDLLAKTKELRIDIGDEDLGPRNAKSVKLR